MSWQELRDYPNWVLYDHNKVPRTILGGPASSTDPGTWSDFDSACSAAEKLGLGVGFVLENTPFVGVDLDHCYGPDGVLHPDAQEIIEKLDSYTEKSHSGDGLHVIYKGAWPEDCRNRTVGGWGGSLEVYDRARYLTFRGDGHGSIANRDATFLIERLGKKAKIERLTWTPTELDSNDEEIIAEIVRRKEWSGPYDEDDSRADHKLCMLICEHTQDPAHVEAIFSASPRGQRDKWIERADYRRMTISSALAKSDPIPEPPEPNTVFRTFKYALDNVPTVQEWLVPGLLPVGWGVKIAGREKDGKGALTLIGILGPLERGERTVFHEPDDKVAPPTTAVCLIEEPPDSFAAKLRSAGLEKGEVVFEHQVLSLTWNQKVDLLVERAKDNGHKVVFIDNISRAAAVTEEAGMELTRACEYLLAKCKEARVSLIVNHHHRKSAGNIGDRSRGSTGVAAAFDNNVEITKDTNNWTDRDRRVSSKGRLSPTIWQKVIRFDEDERGYTIVSEGEYSDTGKDLSRTEWLLRHPEGVTATEAAEAWGVQRDTAYKWLRDNAFVSGKRGSAKLYSSGAAALAAVDSGPGF